MSRFNEYPEMEQDDNSAVEAEYTEDSGYADPNPPSANPTLAQLGSLVAQLTSGKPTPALPANTIGNNATDIANFWNEAPATNGNQNNQQTQNNGGFGSADEIAAAFERVTARQNSPADPLSDYVEGLGLLPSLEEFSAMTANAKSQEDIIALQYNFVSKALKKLAGTLITEMGGQMRSMMDNNVPDLIRNSMSSLISNQEKQAFLNDLIPSLPGNFTNPATKPILMPIVEQALKNANGDTILAKQQILAVVTNMTSANRKQNPDGRGRNTGGGQPVNWMTYNSPNKSR
jgi:hypothetical protein